MQGARKWPFKRETGTGRRVEGRNTPASKRSGNPKTELPRHGHPVSCISRNAVPGCNLSTGRSVAKKLPVEVLSEGTA